MLDDIDIKKVQESDADPIVKESYSALRRFREATSRKAAISRRNEAWENAIDNNMWEADDEKQMKETGQVPVVYNQLNKGVQGSAAIVTANKPEIKVLPTRMNDPYISELLKWAVDFVWVKNEGNDVVYDWVEEKNLGGVGWVSARHDESKGIFGRIVFAEEDPTFYYFDPLSRDRYYRDSHVIKAQLRTKNYIKEYYPQLKDDDLTFESPDSEDIEDSTGELTDTKTGEDNYTIDVDKSDPRMPAEEDKRVVWEMECWWLKVEKEHWARITLENSQMPIPVKIKVPKDINPRDVLDKWVEENNSEENPVAKAEYWPRTMSNRYLRIIVGKKIIEQKDPEDESQMLKEIKNPYGTDSDGDPVMPTVPLKSQRTRTAFCMSPTTYAIPINKSRNKRQAQFLYAVSQTLNSPLMREEGSRWEGPPSKPGSELIIPKNTAHIPQRLPPGTVDLGGLSVLIEEDKRAIDDQYDMPEVAKGKIPRGTDPSGRGILALQDSANMMSNPQLTRLESAIIQLAKVLLAIILKKWNKWMWERLIQTQDFENWRPPEEQQGEPSEPGGEEEAAEKEKNVQRWMAAIDYILEEKMTLVDLDVRITSGASLPTNRMLRNAESVEMYKAGLFTRTAALEHSNHPNAKEMGKELDEREQQLAQAGMLKK